MVRERSAKSRLFQGTAFDVIGRVQGSMGVDCGDYDNDGWLDFMHTCFQDEMPVLYRNSDRGTLKTSVA